MSEMARRLNVDLHHIPSETILYDAEARILKSILLLKSNPHGGTWYGKCTKDIVNILKARTFEEKKKRQGNPVPETQDRILLLKSILLLKV